jgi:hypothetical protein
MKNDYKEQLQRQYDSFVNLNGKRFFLGLADYVKFIVEIPPLFQIVKNFILEEEKKDTEEFENLKKKVRKELEESEKKLFREIRKKKIISPQLKIAIEEYKGLKKGRIQQSIPIEDSYHEALAEIVWCLHNLGYKNIVASFAKINPSSGLIEKYNLSKNYLKYLKEKQHQEYLNKISSIWGSWHRLVLIYQAIHGKKELEEERDALIKKKRFLEAMEITLLVGGMQKVLNEQSDKFTDSFFNKDKYIVDLNRLHNYLMSHIESIIPASTEEPYLDTQNMVLQYGDIIHRFQRKRESIVYKLFAHLWEFRQRRHISGRVLKQGEAFPKYALPNNLDVSEQEIKEALKSIKRILAKGFPIELKIANGVQLIVTTKKKK